MVAPAQNQKNLAANNNGPQQARGNQKPGQKQNNPEQNRLQGKSLASHAKEGVEKATSAFTRGVINEGGAVAKEGANTAIKMMLHTTFAPINGLLHSLPGGPVIALKVASPLTNWLSEKVETYAKESGTELPMKPKDLVERLLMGHHNELSDELVEFVSKFLEKSLNPQVKAALESGNPIQIAKVTGVNLTVGAKGMLQGIKNVDGGKGNLFTNFFKWVGKKTPILNKLTPKLQPWGAGLGVFLFGGVLVRLAIKVVKWVVAGGALAAAIGIGKKMLTGGGGAARGLMGGGAEAAGGVGGLMNMLSKGAQIAGAMGGGAKGKLPIPSMN